MFKDLDRLQVLDLGGNKISSVVAGSIEILISFQIFRSKLSLLHKMFILN